MDRDRDAGLLFCFKRFSASRLQTDGWQRTLTNFMIDMLTWSDYVHVEMVPVSEHSLGRFTLCPCSYTAFPPAGFVRRESKLCCDSAAYTHLFLPLSRDATHYAHKFLDSLVGSTYNSAGALTAAWHEWIQSREVGGEKYVNEWYVDNGDATTRRVFCSEAGLMLCYMTGAYAGAEQPRLCTPKVLYQILQECKAVKVAHLCG